MKLFRIYTGLLLTLLGLSVEPVYAAAVSQNEIEVLEQQAAGRQQKHKKLQAQASQLNMQLGKINQNLIAAAKKIQQQEAAATKSEEELKLLEKKLAVSEKEFNSEYQKLKEMLLALQNLATHPTQSMLVMPLTPVEVVRSAVLMRESVPYLNDKAQKLKADLEKIAKQKKDVEGKIESLKKQKEKLQKQQASLKKLLAEKTALRKKVEGESRKSREEALKLASQASDLRELLEKAEQEQRLRQRKQEEIRKAAKAREEAARQRLEEEQRRRLAEGRGSGLQAEDGQDEDVQTNMVRVKPQKVQDNVINFASAKGKLTRPVSGSLMTSYGQELSKGVSSKGLVFKTRSGAQVVAPYDGSVIFSGPFKGYGNLIIVEHGQGYVSLLAGMSSVDTENGQMVLAGEPVGTMPNSEAAKLYFEIRQNQRPINPAPWFGNFINEEGR